MVEEVWRPVVGYEGLYEISNLGEVKSLDRIVVNKLGNNQTFYGKTLAKIKDEDGYVRARLSKDSKVKNLFIHRMVAKEFIDNPDNKPCVNHKDGVKDNNIHTNLEWSTHEENEKHKRQVLKKGIGELVHNSKLTTLEVIEIKELINQGVKSRRIAEKFNVTEQNIFRIKNKLSWTHIK